MKRISLPVVVTSVFLSACTSEESPSQPERTPDPLAASESIASVNAAPISVALLEVLSLTAAQRDASALTAEQQSQLTEQLILMQLMADDAERSGLHLQREIAAELAFQRLQSLARAATEEFRANNPPTEAELREAYQDNLPRYLATQYKARHILVPTEDEARAIIQELDNGAAFADMAREHSTGPTGPQGGDLDWFTADSMVAPFAEAVTAAEIGIHTPNPVQTRFGWHVILVEDKREQQEPGLEAVREELVSIVERRKLDEYVVELRRNAVIEVVAE